MTSSANKTEQLPVVRRFDAFISYSHRSDASFAATFHRVLQSFGAEFFRSRDLRVFLDNANAEITDDLWERVLQPALQASGYFLLLASPGSAVSEWVAREIAEYLSKVSATEERLPLGIVLVSGKTPWTDNDFDPKSDSTAVSPDTIEVFRKRGKVPLVIDLRSFQTKSGNLRLNNSSLGHIASIKSALTGRPKDEIWGEHIRRLRHRIWLLGFLVSIAFAAAGAAFWQYSVASRNEKIAKDNEATAIEEADGRSRELAAFHRLNGTFQADVERHPLAAAHHYYRAAELLTTLRNSTPRDDSARHNLLLAARLTDQTGRLVSRLRFDNELLEAEYVSGGSRVVTRQLNGPILVWDLAKGTSKELTSASMGSTQFAVSSDKKLVLTWPSAPFDLKDSTGGLVLHDIERQESSVLMDRIAKVRQVMFALNDRVIVANHNKGTIDVWKTQDFSKKVTIDASESSTFEIDRTGTRLLTAVRDGATKLWDINTGEVIATLESKGNGYARFNKMDDQLLTETSVTGASPRLFNSLTGKLIKALPFKVWTSSFSRDGRTVIAAPDDKTIRVFDSRTGAESGVLRYATFVVSLSLDCVERRVITWGGENFVRLWNLDTGDLIGNLWQPDFVRDAVFNRDGSRVLTWGNDGSARIWNSGDGNLVTTLPHRGVVREAKFVSDDREVLSWADDGTVRLWDIDKAIPKVLLARPSATWNSISTAGVEYEEARGSLLAWGHRSCDVWDVSGHGRISELRLDKSIANLQLIAGGSRAITWGAERWGAVWDIKAGNVLFELEHKGGGFGLNVNRDESRVLTWSKDKNVRLWDTANGTVLRSWQYELEPSGAEIDSSKSRVLATYQASGTARRSVLWDVNSNHPVCVFEGSGFFGHDGRHVIGGDQKQLMFVSAVNGKAIKQLELKWPESRMLVGHAYKRLVIIGKSGPKMIDLTSLEELDLAQVRSDMVFAAFPADAADDAILLVGSNGGTVWDAQNKTAEFRMEHEGSVSGAVFSPDKRWIVTWTGPTVRVWNRQEKRLITSHLYHEDVGRVALSRDGTRLLAWTNGEVVTQIDVATGTTIRTLRMGEWARNVEFIDDDRSILTLGTAKTLQLWDGFSGDRIHAFRVTDTLKGALYSSDLNGVIAWDGNKAMVIDCSILDEPARLLRELEARSATRLDASGELQIDQDQRPATTVPSANRGVQVAK